MLLTQSRHLGTQRPQLPEDRVDRPVRRVILEGGLRRRPLRQRLRGELPEPLLIHLEDAGVGDLLPDVRQAAEPLLNPGARPDAEPEGSGDVRMAQPEFVPAPLDRRPQRRAPRDLLHRAKVVRAVPPGTKPLLPT